MHLSNRILASFLIVFIISIVFGTITVLENLTGLVGQQQRAQVSVTVAGVCGDNSTAGGNELCDGTDLDNQTCVTQGFDGGTLSCASNCYSFTTTQCTNVTVAAAVAAAAARTSTGGLLPEKLVYDSDKYDTYDFTITRVRVVYVIFKGETYFINVDAVEESSARLKITPPADLNPTYLDFGIGQTKPIDLDEDGILDFYITLTDILTRRAVFHIEKFKSVSRRSSITGIQVPKLESPKPLNFTDYYAASFLLLAVIVLAIINFAIFKKFIISKK